MARRKKIKKFTSYREFVFDFFKGKKPFEKRSARNISSQELYDIIAKHFEEKGEKFSYSEQGQLSRINRDIIFDTLYEESQQWYLSSGQQGGFTRRQDTLWSFVHDKLCDFYRDKFKSKSVNMLFDVSFSNTWRNSIGAFRGYLGPIIASNSQEAVMLANTLYGFLDPVNIVKDSKQISANLRNVEYSPSDFFNQLNNATSLIDKSIATLEEEIVDKRKNIERLELIKTTVTTNANSFVDHIKENNMSDSTE